MFLCLQEQEEALKELDERIEEVQREREKETEVKRVFTNELKHLREEEKRKAKEKEVMNIKRRMLRKRGERRRGWRAELEVSFVFQVSEEKLKCLEVTMEAERSAHLETRFTCQLLQVTISHSSLFFLF